MRHGRQAERRAHVHQVCTPHGNGGILVAAGIHPRAEGHVPIAGEQHQLRQGQQGNAVRLPGERGMQPQPFDRARRCKAQAHRKNTRIGHARGVLIHQDPRRCAVARVGFDPEAPGKTKTADGVAEAGVYGRNHHHRVDQLRLPQSDFQPVRLTTRQRWIGGKALRRSAGYAARNGQARQIGRDVLQTLVAPAQWWAELLTQPLQP